ncbi:hypothetical protein JZY91_07795 [Corynebacterium sp. CNCTC7651]|uniref:hypothetical protein n=1 Tax=Corynebacterium sp. CNCTC7651 TaxID=2815361 RepID=UPI001F18DFC9|nr:hypothetical protein [Corynebacterium sp. CNCTC7651]UIZ91643.1 hypothetical protein JZY91_07795 [Corynebacterium sp. CNCTC7651]
MHAELTDRDVETLENCLALLARAGVTLAQDVEPADVEDAVADELELFRAYPLTTVAGLDDPDGAPLLAGAVVSGAEVSAGAATAGGLAGADAIVEIVERFAGAAGAEATDVAVMPDPETGGATGSVRVRFGLWDVADINYSFDEGADPRDFELDIVAAALPLDAAAATFPTPDGRDVTLFIPAEADQDAVDELFAAIEAEFSA